MTVWEISRAGFRWLRQTDWWKAVCIAFFQPKEGTGSIFFVTMRLVKLGLMSHIQHSFKVSILIRCKQINHWQKYEQMIYISVWNSALSWYGVRWFLLRSRSLKFLPYLYRIRSGVHLWNASGFGMAWGLHLLFPESNQQSYKQPAKEAQGCSGSAWLCKKRLWCRL